jgi:diacylglycerol kinase family enzyme
VARGADALAAAGGDGTQALVASIAAEHDLPFACIPAGTRNHFALDLGVDRDDVVGALDAFVSGGERRVDLAEVNGRTFVNNVSLGLYADAVQRSGYRDAKLRTILDTVPDVLAPQSSAGAAPLQWSGPDGRRREGAVIILISNNTYRLGRLIGSGTRPRIDEGLLGIALLESGGLGRAAGDGGRPWQEWSAPTFQIDASAPVPAGVDGEALMLDPPLVFAARHLALRVRIAPQHPGASPSAAQPSNVREGLRMLVRIAGGATIDAVLPGTAGSFAAPDDRRTG